jgi:hypothetical protein
MKIFGEQLIVQKYVLRVYGKSKTTRFILSTFNTKDPEPNVRNIV